MTDLPTLLADRAAVLDLELPFDGEGLTAAVAPEAALAALPRLRRTTGAIRWLHGDLILALIDGDMTRSHEAFQQIADLDIDDRPSLMRSLAVAYAVPRDRRRPSLSWSHHRAVAGFGDPADQDRWLDAADTNGWTVAQLEHAITDDLTPDPDPDSEMFPEAKPWHQRHRGVLAKVDEAFAADPDCAVILRADGTVRVYTEPS